MELELQSRLGITNYRTGPLIFWSLNWLTTASAGQTARRHTLHVAVFEAGAEHVRMRSCSGSGISIDSELKTHATTYM